ncbi:MAG: lytic transglycosylase domain-containing protein [Pseudomonadota bacterium]
MRWMFIILCAGIGQSAFAEDTSAPPPFPKFEARHVSVAPKGAPRKLVQIDPTAEPLALTPQGWTRSKTVRVRRPDVEAPSLSPQDGPQSTASGWFWAGISPSVLAADPNRLDRAILQLSQAPGGPRRITPSLSAMQELASTHGHLVQQHTRKNRVSPAFALAVIWTESAGKTDAVSHAGAGGLMQLMPATAERFGVKDRMNPGESIRGGTTYLDWLLERFDDDPLLALAGYNAGEGAVDAYEGVPPYAETRAYVPKVLAAWAVAKELCVSAPRLATDPCVFDTRYVQASANGG